MNEINKIGSPNIEIKPQNTQQGLEDPVTGKSFEDQLLKTVEKLESMGSEIDAMMQSQATQNPAEVTDDVSQVGSYIKSVAGLVENISSGPTRQVPSAQNVIDIYERMNPTHKS